MIKLLPQSNDLVTMQLQRSISIGDLPPEVIANIIKCIKMSVATYKTLSQVSRLFNNAINLIPKVIDINLTIVRKEGPNNIKNASDGQSIWISYCSNALFCWRAFPSGDILNDMGKADITRQCLYVGWCDGYLNSETIPEDPIFMLGYLRQLAIMSLFKRAFVSNIKVFCSACVVQEDYSVYDDASREAVFSLLRAARPKLKENVDVATFLSIAQRCPLLKSFRNIVIDGNDFCSACEEVLDDDDTISFDRITWLTIHFAQVNLIDLAVFADGLHRSFPNIVTLNLKFDMPRDRVIPVFGKDPSNLKRIFESLDTKSRKLVEVYVECEWLCSQGPFNRVLGQPVMDSFSEDDEMLVIICESPSINNEIVISHFAK
ncbi:hypothetical protein HDU76_011757 [Blyttiomyces sp. JEL0837]|nr:hypothetical protein HDU76_011757 [Blyttiomyces sp. JEL0837]